MSVRLNTIIRAEVDAVETVLAGAHSQSADGYWRSVAEDCVQAAKAAARDIDLHRARLPEICTGGQAAPDSQTQRPLVSGLASPSVLRVQGGGS